MRVSALHKSDLPEGLLERIFDRIEVPSLHPSACWPWGGYKSPEGYGTIKIASVRRSPLLVHRVVFVLTKGDLPEGMVPNHKCRHPWCARPDHLVRATFAENSGDNVAKRRTECVNGHPFTPENTRIRKNGTRQCRQCGRDRYGLAA